MRIKQTAKNGISLFLIMWISAGFSQQINVQKKTNAAVTKTNKEKLASIEKACQTIIDDKSDYHSAAGLSNADASIPSSDINLLEVLGNISSELQNDKNHKPKTQLDTIKTFNAIYSKEKYETLISHSKEFIKKTEFLSQTLHKKGDGFEAALKTNKLEDQNMVLQKMGLAFHTMGSRLDSSIMELQKTLPYLDEVYTRILAVENDTAVTLNGQSNLPKSNDEQVELFRKLSSSATLTKSLYGVVLYLAAIKNCNITVSKIQDDLAFLAKAARSEKNN